MQLKIEQTNTTENRKLFYILDAYSFDMEPTILAINIEICINYLTLATVDESIIEVSGFCPYGTWIKSDHNPPSYCSGTLKVITDKEPGFSYRINEKDWPIYVNIKTGWVCVGNPEAAGEAVEFINNCVAVVNKDDQLVALWLKPESLPPL